MGEVVMKEATLKELGLDKTPFPEGFTPKWYAGDSAEPGYVFFVFDAKPIYFDCENYWDQGLDINGSEGYFWKVGHYDTNDNHISSVYGTAPHPRDTLIRITGEEL